MLGLQWIKWVTTFVSLVSMVPVTRASHAADPARHDQPTATASDSIVLQSRDSYCRGGNPFLRVTGTNVTWYADASKKIKLAEGNTYQAPSLDQTTTFYLTQTLAEVETPAVAITIEIVEAFLRNIVTTPATCGKNDGLISVTATGGTAHNPLYYSLNRGPAQRSPVFTNLAPGTSCSWIRWPPVVGVPLT
ncbi:hypothetical protein BH09BAC4_BH09BAC4_09810 [soil metagenome]